MNIKARVENGLSEARAGGLDVDNWSSLRRYEGRSQPVTPGFDPWRATLRFGPQTVWEKVNWAEVTQIRVAQYVKKLKRRVRKGDGKAILEGVDLVVRHGLVAPDWLAGAFCARTEAFLEFEFANLGQAFGIKALTERKRIKEYEKRWLIPAVHRILRGLIELDPTRAIDALLFEEAGVWLNVKPTKCRQLYDEGCRRYGMADIQLVRRVVENGGSFRVS